MFKSLFFIGLVVVASAFPVEEGEKVEGDVQVSTSPNFAPVEEGEKLETGVHVSSTPKYYKPSEVELDQNRNARYQFSSQIEDHINDLTHTRKEVRNGLNVEGTYSYSDGFFKRTVHYVADDKGFRITGEEVVPLSQPQINLNGTAIVKADIQGTQYGYKVQSVPAPGPVPKILHEEVF